MPEDDDRAPLPHDLQALQRFANAMDRAVKVPGLPVHFGLDALLGLLPGAGDIAAGAMSASLLVGALRHRVPVSVVARMAFWIVFDILLGVVPVAGDILDTLFQSNTRNLALLLAHRDATQPPRSVPGLVGGVLGVALAGMGITVPVVAALAWAAFAAR